MFNKKKQYACTTRVAIAAYPNKDMLKAICGIFEVPVDKLNGSWLKTFDKFSFYFSLLIRKSFPEYRQANTQMIHEMKRNF